MVSEKFEQDDQIISIIFISTNLNEISLKEDYLCDLLSSWKQKQISASCIRANCQLEY
jgi:hypothetical protein